MRFFPYVAISIMISLPAIAQDFDRGEEAYRRGDFEAALLEWRPLAESGDAKAQFRIGFMYEVGWGVPLNQNEALKWYQKSAEQGYPEAQNMLGNLYLKGYLVPQDFGKAAAWFLKAAKHGHAESQVALGKLYSKGQGVPQDTEEALNWYLESAIHGSVEAEYILGELYSLGRSVPQDNVKAYMWFSLASDKVGNVPIGNIATRKRDLIAQRMSTKEIMEAEKLATEWAKKKIK